MFDGTGISCARRDGFHEYHFLAQRASLPSHGLSLGLSLGLVEFAPPEPIPQSPSGVDRAVDRCDGIEYEYWVRKNVNDECRKWYYFPFDIGQKKFINAETQEIWTACKRL